MNNNGSMLIGSLLVLVLTILAAGILLRSVNESANVRRVATSTEAFWSAEAGVQKSVYDYNYNNCNSFVQQGSSTHCVTCSNCGVSNKTLAVSITSSCDYDVTINNSNTIMTSTASCPNRSATNPIKRVVQASMGITSPFAYAAFAKNSVNLSNNTFVDSYISSNGAYSNATSLPNGDVGTNGTGAGTIVVNNNATVEGNVSTGSGGTVTVGSGGLITGTTTHNNNVLLPDVSVPSTLTGLVSGGTYSFSNGQTKTLTAGAYKYTNISMGNNATLNITGGIVQIYLTGVSALTASNNTVVNIASGSSLQIYVDGVLNINNNVALNVSGNLPKNLQIYSTYSGANGMQINNNSHIYAAVYAPNTDISIGNNGDIFGSLIGKTVVASNNAAVHYDETLKTITTTSGTTGVTNWQEI